MAAGLKKFKHVTIKSVVDKKNCRILQPYSLECLALVSSATKATVLTEKQLLSTHVPLSHTLSATGKATGAAQ